MKPDAVLDFSMEDGLDDGLDDSASVIKDDGFDVESEWIRESARALHLLLRWVGGWCTRLI